MDKVAKRLLCMCFSGMMKLREEGKKERRKEEKKKRRRKGDVYELVEFICILYHSHCICDLLFLLEKKISLDGTIDFHSHFCYNQPFCNAIYSQ